MTDDPISVWSEPAPLAPQLWEPAEDIPRSAETRPAGHRVPAGDLSEPGPPGVPGPGVRTRVAIARIDPDPRNPRAPGAQEIRELAASLTSHGLLQPILVRPVGKRYMVVAGHRRLAAWLRCASDSPSDPRWRSIDVLIRDIGAEEALTLMLVENLQRKALSPVQEAFTLQRLRLERDWTNRQIAEAIGKSEMYVSRRLRVLEDPALRDAVLQARLSVTTAEELLAADVGKRGQLVERAIAESWSPNDARHALRQLGPTRRDAADERWRASVQAFRQLLDQGVAPPAALKADLAHIAERLRSYCRA